MRPVCVRIADSVGGGGRDGDEDVAAAVFEVRPPLPRVIPDGMLGAGDQPQAVAVDVYIDALTQLPSVSRRDSPAADAAADAATRPVEAGVNRQAAGGTAGDKAGAEAPAPRPPPLPSPPGRGVVVRWMGLSAAALTAYAAEEAEMRSHEAQVARTLSAKNEFEAGVYALRARLDDDLGAHGGGSSMRESLRGALDEAEEWLCSESGEAEAAQVYEEELEGSHALFSDTIGLKVRGSAPCRAQEGTYFRIPTCDSVASWWEDEPPTTAGPRVRGLVNLGNTCFMNCILRFFAHCPLLAWYFLCGGHNPLVPRARREPASAEDSEVPTPRRVCMACEMDLLFCQLFSAGRNR